MRGPQGLALAVVILQRIFEHNQAEFTRKDSRSVPVIAVLEEAQSVLGSVASQGEAPSSPGWKRDASTISARSS